MKTTFLFLLLMGSVTLCKAQDIIKPIGKDTIKCTILEKDGDELIYSVGGVMDKYIMLNTLEFYIKSGIKTSFDRTVKLPPEPERSIQNIRKELMKAGKFGLTSRSLQLVGLSLIIVGGVFIPKQAGTSTAVNPVFIMGEASLLTAYILDWASWVHIKRAGEVASMPRE